MDIPRESVAKRRMIRRVVFAAFALTGLGAVTVGLARLEPALPTVDRATVLTGQVSRGAMLRQVRGTGTLVPEIVWWIPAVTSGRVERILVLPGTLVSEDTVLLELSDPQVELDAVDAEWLLKSAEAELASLSVRLRDAYLELQASSARIEADYQEARLRQEVDKDLFRDGLISKNNLKLSEVRVTELAKLIEIAKQRMAMNDESQAAAMAAQQARVERSRALHRLKQAQVEALSVQAGTTGVLEQMPVQVGERVMPGAVLAKVTDPHQLKAVIKIPETQAREVRIGQKASIDTRNGIASGRVTRIDPAVLEGSVAVDVAFDEGMPEGARPDQNIVGTIEIERLQDILYTGRPVYGQAFATIGLFRIDPDGETASRVSVELGKTSVNTVEVRRGLELGDQIILSDMSRWDEFEKVRLR